MIMDFPFHDSQQNATFAVNIHETIKGDGGENPFTPDMDNTVLTMECHMMFEGVSMGHMPSQRQISNEWLPPLSCGLSPPLSLSPPTVNDMERNKTLIKYLESQRVFDTKEDTNRKENAIQILKQIAEQWIAEVARRRALKSDVIEKAHVKIYTYGSYALNVSGPDSDIDAVCIGPSYASRETDFFVHFYNMLVAREDVTEVMNLPATRVPMIKFKLSGVSFDLCYARLRTAFIKKDEKQIDPNHCNYSHYFEKNDEESERSLQGWIIYRKILSLFPPNQGKHIRPLSNFRTTLRCIKFWTQKRGISSNLLGLLGGVNCAILVAKICLLFPNALPCKLVSYFFKLYSEWKWPTSVLLCPIQGNLCRNYDSFAWDPRLHYRDRSVMVEEFRRANTECQREENNSLWNWEDIFVGHDSCFEDLYDYFLVLVIEASNNQDLYVWSSYVLSSLVTKLFIPVERRFEMSSLVGCHPKIVQYIDRDKQNEHHVVHLIGLKGLTNHNSSSTKVTIENIVDNFSKLTLAASQKFRKTEMAMEIKMVDKTNLPSLIIRKKAQVNQHSNLTTNSQQVASYSTNIVTDNSDPTTNIVIDHSNPTTNINIVTDDLDPKTNIVIDDSNPTTNIVTYDSNLTTNINIVKDSTDQFSDSVTKDTETADCIEMVKESTQITETSLPTPSTGEIKSLEESEDKKANGVGDKSQKRKFDMGTVKTWFRDVKRRFRCDIL